MNTFGIPVCSSPVTLIAQILHYTFDAEGWGEVQKEYVLVMFIVKVHLSVKYDQNISLLAKNLLNISPREFPRYGI